MVTEQREKGFNTMLQGANKERVKSQHEREKADQDLKKQQLARLNRKKNFIEGKQDGPINPIGSKEGIPEGIPVRQNQWGPCNSEVEAS